jgi:hypothetical protein
VIVWREEKPGPNACETPILLPYERAAYRCSDGRL